LSSEVLATVERAGEQRPEALPACGGFLGGGPTTAEIQANGGPKTSHDKQSIFDWINK
jgi:hypothetical protein